jgi:hypothetical protein
MSTQTWSLDLGHVPELLASIVLVGCAALAAAEGVAVFRRGRSGTPRRIHLAILGLRFLAILGLLGVAFELTLRIEQVAPAGRRVVVLADRSASMALPDAAAPGRPTQTRQARAEEVWAQSRRARESWSDDGLMLEVRGFDTSTVPYSAQLAETLATTPDGAGSDLAAALTELTEEDRIDRAPLAAVVVISDGLVANDSAADRHVRAVAEALGLPITTVSVGAPAIRDVSVADVRAGDFAFVENVAEFEASIVAHGLQGTDVIVELRRDGEVVREHPLMLAADGVPQTVRFEVAPDRVGQFVYEVAIPEVEDEATIENNRRAFVVKVLRDKVRVLHVAGRPDWDVRALRTLLRRDPNVELLSYYILRGFDDITREDTTAPLSLIPFPTDELFEQELGSFDLVILHNFDALAHQVGQYVENMAQYVVDGGALVLIGGDLGLVEGGYAELAPLLPVDTRRSSTLHREEYRPSLTDAGARHPITAWLAKGGWDALPELDTFNPLALSPKADRIGASVLLEHPQQRDGQGDARPLLAVAEPGRGRTMVLATGSTWRLGFAPDLPLIDGARPYDLLWLGAVRWLLRDDSSGRLSLETDKPRYRAGEPIELRAKTVSASYAAEADVDVRWEVLPLTLDGGERSDGPDGAATTRAPVVSGQWTTDGLGRAHEMVEPLPVGAYAAVARRDLVEESEADAESSLSTHEVRRVFVVEPPGRELARVDADPGIERLRALADATGGEALAAVDGDTLPAKLPLGEDPSLSAGRILARKDIPLWNGWAALLLLAVAFGGEWLLRRRHGEQ